MAEDHTIDPLAAGVSAFLMSGFIIKTLVEKGVLTEHEATSIITEALGKIGGSHAASARQSINWLFPNLKV